MKLWEMLRDGKVGDRFQCVSAEESWNEKVYELISTTSSFCVQRVGARIGEAGYLLEMCSAVINADWVKLPKPVVYVDFELAYDAFMLGRKVKSVNSNHAYDPERENAFLVDDIRNKWIIIED